MANATNTAYVTYPQDSAMAGNVVSPGPFIVFAAIVTIVQNDNFFVLVGALAVVVVVVDVNGVVMSSSCKEG